MLRPKNLVLLLLALLAACKPAQTEGTSSEGISPEVDAEPGRTMSALASPIPEVKWRETFDAGGPSAGDINCLRCDGGTSNYTYTCPGPGAKAFWTRGLKTLTGGPIPDGGVQLTGVSAKISGASVRSNNLNAGAKVSVRLNDLPLGEISSPQRICSGNSRACDATGGAKGVVSLSPTASMNDLAAAWKADGGNELIFERDTDYYCLSAVELQLQFKQRIIEVSPPEELDFGNQRIFQRSANRAVTVSNLGDAPLEIHDVAILAPDGGVSTGPFKIEQLGSGATVDAGTGDGGTQVLFTVDAGASADIALSFTPLELDAFTDYKLRIDSNSAKSRTEIALRGEGVEHSVDISPPEYDFGDVRVGSQANLTVKVRNIDSQPVSIESISMAVEGEGLTLSSDAGTPLSLNAGQEKALQVHFQPTQQGEALGVLSVKSKNAADSDLIERTASFTARGVQPVPVFTPDGGLDFGPVTAGEAPTDEVLIENTGLEALTLVAVRVREDAGTSPFKLLNPLSAPVTLSQGDDGLPLTVEFKAPEASGLYAGALEFISNDGGIAPFSYNLTGRSVRPELVWDPLDAGDFGTVRVGTTREKALVLRNRGTGSIHVTDLRLGKSGSLFALDGGSPDFVIAGDGGSRNITVAFSPNDSADGVPVDNTVQVTTDPPRFNPSPYVVSGRGAKPQLVFEPTGGGVFGEVPVATGGYKEVTLRNKGSGNIDIQGVGLAPGSSPLFSLDAGVVGTFTLAPDAGRVLGVFFRPQGETNLEAGGIRVASDDSAYNPADFPLSGVGVQPVVSISSDAGTDFGDVLVNQTPSKTVTIVNSGSQSIVINNVTLDGGALFDVVGSPPTNFTLDRDGGSRDVTVRFKPTVATEVVSATFSLASDAGFVSPTYVLTGRGVRPEVVVEPVDGGWFGDVRVGTPKSTEVTLRNKGTQKVRITGVAVTGNSHFTADAGEASFDLTADGGSHIVTVQFTPSVDGVTEQGNLAFTSEPSAFAPALYPLGGRGIQPNVQLTPLVELSFGEVRVGTDGGLVKPVKMENRGTGPITFSSIQVEGDPAFSLEPLAEPTPTLQALDGGLSLMVRFIPGAEAPTDAGVLRIVSADPAFGSKQITLQGEGVKPTLGSVSPVSLDFPPQDLGSASGYSDVTVSNIGTGTLIVDSFDASGPFEVQPISRLEVKGEPKTIGVRFRPVSQDAGTGWLTFKTSDPEHPDFSVPLSGTGRLNLSVTTKVDFESVRNKDTKSGKITLQNNNDAGTITVHSITLDSESPPVGPPFTTQFSVQDAGTNWVLGPSSSKDLTVSFNPQRTGNASARLTVNSTASNGTQHVELQGRSIQARLQISLPDDAAGTGLDFGGVPVSSASAYVPRTVRFTNTGDAPLNINTVLIEKSLPGGGRETSTSPFSYSGSTTAELAADGGAIEASVQFKPMEVQAYTGYVLVVNAANAADLRNTFPLSGTGTAAVLEVAPLSTIEFGNQRVNTTSGMKPLAISNKGLAELEITGTSDIADFKVVDSDGGVPFPLKIPPNGGATTLHVVFKPMREGRLDAGLSFNSNAYTSPGQSQPTVPLTGNGIEGRLEFDGSLDGGSSRIDFGSTPLDTIVSRTVRMRNNGNDTLTLRDAGIEPTGNGVFSILGFNSRVMNPGDTAEFSVSFMPDTNGYTSANLAVTSDSYSNGIQNILLTGTGVGPQLQYFAGSAVKFEPTNHGAFTTKGLVIGNVGAAGGALRIDSITFERMPLPGSDGGTTDAGAGDYDVTANFIAERTYPDGGNVFPLTIEKGGQKEISLRFNPTGVGFKEARGRITANAKAEPFTVSGMGTFPTLTVEPSDGGLEFSGVMVDTVSFPRKIRVTNSGGPITFTSIVLSGPGKDAFEVSPDLSTLSNLTLEKDQSEEFHITFKPTKTTSFATASFKMNSKVSIYPQVNIPLTGYAETEPVTFDNRVDFGLQRTNDAAEKTLTVSSNTETRISLTQIRFEGPDSARFSLFDTPATPIALTRGAPQQLKLRFLPLNTGPANANLLLTFSNGTPMTVQLVGEGVSSAVTINPNPLDFGGFRVKDPAREEALTFLNETSTDITLDTLDVTARDNYFTLMYAQTGTDAGSGLKFNAGTSQVTLDPPLVLKPKEPRVLLVSYNPSAQGLSETKVAFGAKTKSWKAEATLKGLAKDRILSATPTDVNFHQVEANKLASQEITITNDSVSEQLVTARLRSTQDSPFKLDSRALENPIAPGRTATITVSFDPRNAGEAENTVELQLSGVNEVEALVPVKGVGRVLTVNGSGCACGATEPGSAGLFLLLALAAQQWRRRRE